MKTDMELRQERDAHRKAARQVSKLLRQRSRKAHGLPKRKKGMGCRIGDRDEAEKVRRGYTEPSSYVRRDGSEVLKGRDWRWRVEELRQRSRGQCEQMVWHEGNLVSMEPQYLRCFAPAVDPHHKIKRSVRRDDRLSNLQHICRMHHEALDPRKIRSGKVGA